VGAKERVPWLVFEKDCLQQSDIEVEKSQMHYVWETGQVGIKGERGSRKDQGV
jgi:hypothetical protein